MPTRNLPVKLNDEELADRGRSVAKAVEDRAALQEEKKAADADINGKMKSKSETIRSLSRVITTGTEDREVALAEARSEIAAMMDGLIRGESEKRK
jgi:hypothetical protein